MFYRQTQRSLSLVNISHVTWAYSTSARVCEVTPRKQKCVQLCWTSATNKITRESCYLAWCPPLRTPLQCPFVYLKRTFHGHSLWTEHLLCISTYAAHLITILISLFITPLPPQPWFLKSPVSLLRYSLSTNDCISFLAGKTEGASPFLIFSSDHVLTAIDFLYGTTYPCSCFCVRRKS